MSLNAQFYPAALTAPTPAAQFQHYAAVVAVAAVTVAAVAAVAAAAAAAAAAAGFDAAVECFAGSVAGAGFQRPWSGPDPRRISFPVAAAESQLPNLDAAGGSVLRTHRRRYCFSTCTSKIKY